MNNIIKFEDLELPALTVIAQEQYEECLWAIEKALKKQLEFGRILLIVKSKLPHGQWGAWVRETFTDHKSLRTIQRHMRGAEAIATDPSLLESADSLDGVLKIVEERKPSVEVIEVAADVPVADVPEAAIEIVAAVERGEITLNAAVETVKPKTTSSETPAAPPHQTKSKSLDEIKLALFRMKSSKKRRDEITQVAIAAWESMSPEQRRDYFGELVARRSKLEHEDKWLAK